MRKLTFDDPNLNGSYPLFDSLVKWFEVSTPGAVPTIGFDTISLCFAYFASMLLAKGSSLLVICEIKFLNKIEN